MSMETIPTRAKPAGPAVEVATSAYESRAGFSAGCPEHQVSGPFPTWPLMPIRTPACRFMIRTTRPIPVSRWVARVWQCPAGRAGSPSPTRDAWPREERPSTVPARPCPRFTRLPSGDFHDITSGSNGDEATPGYDMVTGLGSPTAYLLVSDLAAYQMPTRGQFGEGTTYHNTDQVGGHLSTALQRHRQATRST